MKFVKLVIKDGKIRKNFGFVVLEFVVGSGEEDTQSTDFRILGNDGVGWFCLFLHGGFQF